MHNLYGAQAKRRVGQVLEQVGLERWRDERVSNYSSGMRQRLAIARSLLHRPQILFLDEPTRSLDPTGTARLHDLLRDLKQREGVTIFLITHDLAEAEKLCSRVGLMHQGRLQVTGTLAELRRELAPRLRYTIRVGNLQSEALATLERAVPAMSIDRSGELSQLHFAAAESDGRLDIVLDCLRLNGATIQGIEASAPAMEEIFAHYTGMKKDV
jgi:ABC-2 type transport system ATP-binding protein